MNPRWAAIAPWCREIALPASVLAVLVALGSASSGTNKVAPIVNRVAPSLTADVKFADRPAHIAAETVADRHAGRPRVRQGGQRAGCDRSRRLQTGIAEPQPVVAAAETNSSEPPAKPFVVASADPTASIAPVMEAAADPCRLRARGGTAAEADRHGLVGRSVGSADAGNDARAGRRSDTGDAAKQIVGTAEVLDECYVIDACADRYLWALYQRTRKEDTVKEKTPKEVTVKRKGKMVTVTRTVTQVVDEDFGWKDPKAADHAGMTMTDYVIGGMDRDFKLQAVPSDARRRTGRPVTRHHQRIPRQLSPVDRKRAEGRRRPLLPWRQLARRLRSRACRRYRQRQWRDARAAPGVERNLWNWVDKHGKDYGIGRPYHDRDPPHVGPIDGSEYVSRHAGGRSRHAAASRARRAAVARADQSVSQRVRTANASAR